jgi:predicted RNA binding protein YcfA (HicA-like mRNA interferase family)
MPRTLSRRELIRRFRALGYRGPFSGGRHRIPNPHGSGDVHISLVKEILRQARISEAEWEEA